MSDSLKKIKNLYGKLRAKQMSYERPGMKPVRDWLIILTSASVALGVIAGVSFYFYTQISQGRLFTITKDSIEKEVKIDEVLLKKTIDDMNNRQSVFLDIKQNKNIPPDPSL